MQYPLEYNGITQGYSKGKHNGIDLGWNLLHGGLNAKIYCVEDGVVHSIQSQRTGGKVLIIKHNGFFSEYGHLSKIVVNVGQKVKRNDYIANMGNTGYSNGKRVPYHLHFGLYKGETFSYGTNNFVNPINYLELYPYQSFSKKTIETYGSKLKYYKEPKKGTYQTLYDMNLRKSPNGAKVKVKDCTDAMQKALTSKKPNDNAVIKKGTNITILEVIEKNGTYWGKNYSGYVCISDPTTTYCKKV